MVIQFNEIRQYLARNAKLSICFEDGHYHDYLMISDIPPKYDEMFVYGIGMEDEKTVGTGTVAKYQNSTIPVPVVTKEP